MANRLAVTPTEPPSMGIGIAGASMPMPLPELATHRVDLIRARWNGASRSLEFRAWKGNPSFSPVAPRPEWSEWDPDTWGWADIATVRRRPAATCILVDDIEVLT